MNDQCQPTEDPYMTVCIGTARAPMPREQFPLFGVTAWILFCVVLTAWSRRSRR